MIGIIIPPGDIKKLAEKTAEHVATNGSEFEKMLIEREQHKAEFAFLQPNSPYRAYYDHKVAEISKKLFVEAQGIIEEEKVEPKIQNQIKSEPIQEKVVSNPQQQNFLQKIFEEVKEPEPDRYTAEIPQKITEGEIAIIQNTAQYVARNGKNFQVALSEREKNNPQFQFLKSSSNNHNYFSKLVEAYSNILSIESEEIAQLEKYCLSKQDIFNKCRQAYEYHRAKQEQSKGKKTQATDKKENNIDWNDFELVETIVFEGDLNKNIKAGELITKLQQNASMIPRSMEEKIISEPKRKEILQQCHVCRQNILASEMNKHLKSCLGQGQKKKIAQNFDGNTDVDIRKNLQGFSGKRPDIFGAQENEIIRKQQSAEDKVIWDGQSENINRATASVAMVQNQQKKLREQQNKK